MTATGGGMPTYQFVRLQGYPRGSARRKGTLASVLAEGRRDPSHSRHVDSPAIEVTPIDTEWDSIREYQAWIEATMLKSVNRQNIHGKVVERKLATNAIAIGTVITSLPSETKDTPRETIDRFREESSEWFRDYLEKLGMRLNYCVLHLDEKFPHLHLWFTPGKEMLSRSEWKMGYVVNPSITIKQDMRRKFFRDVGNKYVDELEKPKEQRKRRIPSRAVAAENRLPPGEPNSESPLMGMPVSKGSTTETRKASSGISTRDIEQTPFYSETILRLMDMIIQHKHEFGTLTNEQIIKMIAERSGASEQCRQELIDRMLEHRRTGSTDQAGQEPNPGSDRLDSFKTNSSGEPSPAAGAGGSSGTEKPPEQRKKRSILDQLKYDKRYTPPET